jgi:hypothetical protein
MLSNTKIRLSNYFPIRKQIINNITYTEKIISAPMLCIRVPRALDSEDKNTTIVIPEETIKLQNGSILKCSSIVIHHGNNINSGHYTCMFKYFKDNLWYHYDDITNNYVKIGSFNDMLKWKKGYVPKNQNMCVYVL